MIKVIKSTINKDVYSFPIVLLMILSTIQAISNPLIFEKYLGLPAVFINNIPLIVIICLFIISRNFKKSERSFIFLYIGLAWFIFLLLLYRLGGYWDAKYYGGYIYQYLHINTNSILALHHYYFLFCFLLLLEGKIQGLFEKAIKLLDIFIKKFIRPTLIEIYKELSDLEK